MERPCFLCGGRVDVTTRAHWPLPRIGTRVLGFGPCERCGTVLQSPSASEDDLARWYAESAVYDAPGRDGAPHPRKVRGTTRLLAMVEHALGRPAERVFQVGASDGYTLARFRDAGAGRVEGLEPSAAARALARERHGIELRDGRIETATDLPDAELWVLSHVLEHLLDPLACLRRIRERLAGAQRAGWVVIEVPLLERPEALPPGYLSFEHVNYFTERSLTQMLGLAGFEVDSLAKEYEDDQYPIVACVARAADERPLEIDPAEVRSAGELLSRHLVHEHAYWKAIDARITAAIAPDAEVRLFGAGVFAAQFLARSCLARHACVVGVLDSSKQKQGASLGIYPIEDPATADLADGVVVITSFASSQEIWDALAPARERGTTVVRLDDVE